MSPDERFWQKVDVRGEGECWSWTGGKSTDGYGRFVLNGRVENAHRARWLLSMGDIPAGMVVRHKCDNPACVNPDHLELGTHAENARDKAVRRRVPMKLSDEGVAAIKAAPGRYADIADQFGVSPAYVCLLKQGTRRQHHVG